MPVILNGVEGIKASAGQHLGKSEWKTVTQERINAFADATEDWDWIHVDPEKAKQSPFGKTIAHGYMTVAWLIPLLKDIYKLENIGMGLNYGINKLRFPAAVPVGSRVRLDCTLKQVDEIGEGVQMTMDCIVECDQTPKPALAAEIVFRFYPSATSSVR